MKAGFNWRRAKRNKLRIMDIKVFLGKFASKFLWGNLIAMAIVVLALFIGVQFALAIYTHHGEGIEVPNLYGVNYDDAVEQMEKNGVFVVASDTGYNKRMEPNCILVQTPGAGTKVKEGRIIYVTINSSSTPKVKIPDIIDNTSYREAQARLTAIGFHLLEPKTIEGERDWVYGVMANDKPLQNGDLVSIETPIVLVIGSGIKDEDVEGDMLDVPDSLGDEVDDFEEVTEPLH